MKDISRKMSYLLRHDPQDLVMNKQGWVSTDQLLHKLEITMDILEEIVSTNDKKRFEFNSDKTQIRASQGHSRDLNVNIFYKTVKDPKIYYHGTTFESMILIMDHGLKPQSRKHVHLSKDIPTAVNVGNRHIKRGDTVVVLEIDGAAMKRDGYKIFISANDVILTDFVPARYIKIAK